MLCLLGPGFDKNWVLVLGVMLELGRIPVLGLVLVVLMVLGYVAVTIVGVGAVAVEDTDAGT